MCGNPLAQVCHTNQNAQIRGNTRLLPGSASGQGLEISSRPEFDACGYCFHEFIDRGGYGIVASVRHQKHPGILYARKQLSKSRIQRAELEKEIALIRKANHRHVVHLVDNYEDKNWCYIVMLPLAAGNLHDYLQHMNTERPRDEESWASFGSQRLQLYRWIHCLAVTLEELHNRNIRHRDIKPQNILISGSNILLTDFGISFSIDGVTKVDLTTSTGTEKYEPPEALQASGDDTWARFRTGRLGDMFSLGWVIFEMLEALSRPLLGIAKFPQMRKPYSILVNDHNFISQVGAIKEHEVLIRKLSEDYRFSGLAEALLGTVMSDMMTTIRYRKTSEAMVEQLERYLIRWHVPLLDCCIHRSGAEIDDRAISSRPSDSDGCSYTGSAFVGENHSIPDNANDHSMTSASLMTTESTKVHSEPEKYFSSLPESLSKALGTPNDATKGRQTIKPLQESLRELQITEELVRIPPFSPFTNNITASGYYPPQTQHPGLDMYGLLALVTSQLDYYFSIDNLIRDIYLRKHMDSRGFVSLHVIRGYERMASMTVSLGILYMAASQSKVVEIRQGDYGEARVRRHEGWEQWVLAMEERDPAARNDGPSTQSYKL